jgi:plastocyanin
MKTKLAVLFALLALVPFAVAACGDDDDEPADETTAATTTEETTDTGGGTGGGGEVVEVSADPSGSLAFEQDSLTAAAGEVTISLTNEASVPHDVVIEGPEGDLGETEEVSGGDTSEVSVELESGEYTFYCSVPGHREAGMEGPLTVE